MNVFDKPLAISLSHIVSKDVHEGSHQEAFDEHQAVLFKGFFKNLGPQFLDIMKPHV